MAWLAEKNNQVAGLINLVRNIGGSILIAITNAMVTERALFHQDQMIKYLSPTDPYFQTRVNALKDVFMNSAGKNNAGGLAQGQIYNQMLRQSQALGYVDVFYISVRGFTVYDPHGVSAAKESAGRRED